MLSLIWVFILLYIAYSIYKINSIEYSEKSPEKNIQIKHIIAIMIFNGPMWIFWLSVCLPTAFQLAEKIQYGEYLFLLVFEIFMILWLSIMLLTFHFFRKIFLNKWLVKKIFFVLAFAIFCIAARSFFAEIQYFLIK